MSPYPKAAKHVYNCQAVCIACHQRKTNEEAQRGRERAAVTAQPSPSDEL